MAGGAARAKAAPRTIDLIDVRRTPGHLLRRAQQRAVDLFVQAVGENGLRPPQFAVLLTVYRHPGLNQTHLVDRTGIDRSTIAEMIDRMVARGYIERKRDAADQRVNTLWATGAGIAALEASVDAVLAAQERILAPVPPEKRAALMEALALLAEVPAGDA
ncbi:MAG: winged helix-turn-helix transcriptional regulator [Candidatus Odyssella sp.]|nr:winged helix-turn-helix transcriptional regulator [Candidatus Odyssella sp.]